MAGVSGQSNNPAVVGQGVFATASFATFKMRKDVELWEICFTMLQKVPKAYNKVCVYKMLYRYIVMTPFVHLFARLTICLVHLRMCMKEDNSQFELFQGR